MSPWTGVYVLVALLIACNTMLLVVSIHLKRTSKLLRRSWAREDMLVAEIDRWIDDINTAEADGRMQIE